jgi:hypothetical protein
MTIIVRVPSQSSTGVSINSQNQQKVRTLTPISTSVTNLTNLSDFSIVDGSNNSVLVYNTSTNKYEIKALPIIFGGTF